MTVDKLSEAIGMIDEDIIAAADKSRVEVKRSRKPLWIGMCSSAACAALITAVALADPAGILSGTDIAVSESSGTTAQTAEVNTTPTDGDDCCANEVDDAVLIPDATTDGNKNAKDTVDVVVDEGGYAETVEMEDAAVETCEPEEIIPDTCEVEVEEEADVVETSEVIKDETCELEEVIPDTCEAEVEEEADVAVTEGVIADTAEYEEAIPDTEEAVEEKVEVSDIISVGGTVLRYSDVELRVYNDTGSPQSYEELQNYISVYADCTNFVLYEITEQLSPEDAYALTGDEMYLISSTLYRARITRDLLSGSTADVGFLLTCAGTEKEQIKDMPLLSVGERYASMLPDFSTEHTNVSMPELTFAVYESNGTEYAYHLRFDKICFVDENGSDIDKGVSEDERYVVTSTANNPVHYVKKLLLDELTDFLRDDWSSRGYIFAPLNDETE